MLTKLLCSLAVTGFLTVAIADETTNTAPQQEEMTRSATAGEAPAKTALRAAARKAKTVKTPKTATKEAPAAAQTGAASEAPAQQ